MADPHILRCGAFHRRASLLSGEATYVKFRDLKASLLIHLAKE
jgi:hypothetical protein